jgi:hypothetical protein
LEGILDRPERSARRQEARKRHVARRAADRLEVYVDGRASSVLGLLVVI